jgi:hypothetical protein
VKIRVIRGSSPILTPFVDILSIIRGSSPIPMPFVAILFYPLSVKIRVIRGSSPIPMPSIPKDRQEAVV